MSVRSWLYLIAKLMLTTLSPAERGRLGGSAGRGKSKTPEHRAAISEGLRGRQLKPEQVAIIRARRVGTWRGDDNPMRRPEVREKVAAAKRGTRHSPETLAKLRTDPAVRFWVRVQIPAEDACWIWTGSVDSSGYGHFWDGSQLISSHRWAYLAEHGTIPAGLELDHLCSVRRCVNPMHLEPVTHSENVRRARA